MNNKPPLTITDIYIFSSLGVLLFSGILGTLSIVLFPTLSVLVKYWTSMFILMLLLSYLAVPPLITITSSVPLRNELKKKKDDYYKVASMFIRITQYRYFRVLYAFSLLSSELVRDLLTKI